MLLLKCVQNVIRKQCYCRLLVSGFRNSFPKHGTAKVTHYKPKENEKMTNLTLKSYWLYTD